MYVCQCSAHPTLPFPPVCSPHLYLYSCPANRFISTIKIPRFFFFFFYCLKSLILSTNYNWPIRSDQIRWVAQSCGTLCDPMNHSTPGLPVHHQLPEFTETHVHRVGDAIQPSHPLSSPSPLAPNPSQHQSLFQWVNSSHEVAKVLEFQL